MPTKTLPSPRITIMSVGGRGATILDRLHHLKTSNIKLVAAGMKQSLEYATRIDQKIELPFSASIHQGVDIATTAKETIDSQADALHDALHGSDLVFLIGNAATEANTYEVAEIAKLAGKLGALVCYVGATAFPFEGVLKQEQVERGRKILTDVVDGFLLIESTKVLTIGNASEGLVQVNRVIEQMVTMIIDIVHTHGIINIDFADLKTTIQNAGPLFFHSIESSETDIESLKESIFTHPTLTSPAVEDMKRVLYVIYTGKDVLMESITTLGDYIADQVHESARILFGVVSDEKMKGKIKVVFIGA